MTQSPEVLFLRGMPFRFNPIWGWKYLVVSKPWAAPTVIVVQALQACLSYSKDRCEKTNIIKFNLE